MAFKRFRGYVLVVTAGVVLAALAVLVALQWRQRAEFNLFGQPYVIRVFDGSRLSGGVNTALLMLLSAAGGLVTAGMLWLLVRGLRILRAVRRERLAQASAPAAGGESGKDRS